MTQNEANEQVDDAAITGAFLRRYLDDGANGEAHPVEHYQALFPGFEATIAREYRDLSSGAARVAADGEDEPRWIGQYRLLRRLGKGGMGTVWLAEQEAPFQRLVALKLIKLGMDTKEVIRRFETERQTLARMNHPGIAKVFDAGATELGRPYFVMEHVEGVRVTSYCDENRLSIRERLELFVLICEATHHAHTAGVIHRDLKPSNVLVARIDGRDVPKIIDFGLAKVIREDSADRTLLTEQGDLLGTLEYMSPEQISGTNLDTRTDVYALGVILYELLTGQLPFDSGGRGTDGWFERVRKLREQDACVPSQCARYDSESLAAVHRSTDSSSLHRVLLGDLDWITMKALEKDKDRRYESAAALAADIQRSLDHQPVLARQPSAAYRLRKFVRRNRALVFGAAIVFLVLVVGSVISATFAVSEGRQRRIAEAALESNRVAYRSNRVELGRMHGQAGDLEAAEDLIWRVHLEDPGSRHSLWALRELYSRRPCLATIRAHKDPVTAVAASHDGRFMAIGSGRAFYFGRGGEVGDIKVFDVSTLECVYEKKGAHDERIWGLAFSPDGTTIASGGYDGRVAVWNLESDNVETLRLSTVRFYGVRFSPDGRLLAAGARGKTGVWDASTLELLHELKNSGGSVWTVCFTDDSKMLATGSYSGEIQLWRPRTGELVGTLPQKGATRPWAMQFTHDGKHLIIARDYTLERWDVEKLVRVEAVGFHEFGLGRGVWIAPDDRTMFVSTESNVALYKVDTLGERSLVTKGLGGRIACIQGGRVIGIGGSDGLLRLWEGVTPGAEHSVAGLSGGWPLTMSTDGRVLAGGAGGHTVALWETRTGRRLATLEGHGYVIHSLVFDHRALRLAVASSDGKVRVWDLTTGSLIQALEGFKIDIGFASTGLVTLSPDGRFVAFVTGTGDRVVVRDVATAEAVGRPLRAPDYVVSVAFSPDGEQIAMGCWDRTLIVHPSPRAQNGLPIRILRLDSEPLRVTWSSDGAQLAVGTRNGGIELWDPHAQTRTALLRGHRGRVDHVIFVPGMRDCLMSCSIGDRALRLWDVPAELCLATVATANNTRDIGLTPDGSTVVRGARRTRIADLLYWDRHIAGQVRYQIERLRPELGDKVKEQQLLAWAAEVLARPSPRMGRSAPAEGPAPVTGEQSIDPNVIARWGRER